MTDPATLPLSGYRPRSRLSVAGSHVPAAAVPAIDAHNHLGRWLTGGWSVPDVPALLALMDECGVRAMVNLDGRWGAELEANLDRYDRAHPGRFATFCHVDWSDLDGLAESLRRSVAAGARGLKVWKDLGLHVRDAAGRLILPDDPRLGPLWETAAELGVPVAIHTVDPVAFFDPVDERKERLEELAAQPDWSFADTAPPTSPAALVSYTWARISRNRKTRTRPTLTRGVFCCRGRGRRGTRHESTNVGESTPSHHLKLQPPGALRSRPKAVPSLRGTDRRASR